LKSLSLQHASCNALSDLIGYARSTAKHPKHPRDPNQLGKLIVDLATGAACEEKTASVTPAQEFARTGGLKGGAARARSLSAEQRQAIT